MVERFRNLPHTTHYTHIFCLYKIRPILLHKMKFINRLESKCLVPSQYPAPDDSSSQSHCIPVFTYEMTKPNLRACQSSHLPRFPFSIPGTTITTTELRLSTSSRCDRRGRPGLFIKTLCSRRETGPLPLFFFSGDEAGTCCWRRLLRWGSGGAGLQRLLVAGLASSGRVQSRGCRHDETLGRGPAEMLSGLRATAEIRAKRARI